MSITPTTLVRGAAAAAVASGLVFIGVQVGHPHLDASTVASTDVVIRNSAKVLMALLALVGVTGMYLRQIRPAGLLGLIGFLVLGGGYLVIAGTSLIAAVVLPAVATSDPAYVDDVLTAATGGSPWGDIGALQAVLRVQDVAFLLGGLLFGVALLRARVLARWAAALLAAGGVVTVVLSLLPEAFYRLLALPNGIAMIALGFSLWRSSATTPPEAPVPADEPVDGRSSAPSPV